MSRPRGRKKANGEQPPANDAAAEDQVVAAAVAEGLGEEAPAPRRGGRPRKPKVRDTMRSFTDQEKLEAKNRAITAHSEYLSKQGEMRNQAKAVTAAIKEVASMTGMSKKSVRWALENRRREPSEIDAETRERTRMAQFFGMPIGSQLGLDLDGKSIADKLETAEQPADGMSSTERAHAQGYAVGKAAGDPQHDYEEGSPEELAYTAGWRQGQDENAGRIGQKPMPAPTHEPAHA